ncbi:MAG: N(4)-(beta-N-acetylglucosaminyl)-L-asparaginase [Saprospiraceae bacterium]|nr:N(4)-(beta-N-acetylglucosaminyl)-L-asparaginase [Saprospiraceae bacterium]
MFNRRDFLNKTFLASLAAGVGLSACESKPKQDEANNNAPGVISPNGKKPEPIVIATWKHPDATQTALEVILNRGSALDGIEAGVRMVEADPRDQSVGYGGLPDRDGIVTLDACVMDDKGNAGSVTFLQHIMHPVSVARKVMEDTPHVMLSGEGAYRFAISKGFKKENLLTEAASTKWKEWLKEGTYKPVGGHEQHDTIGMLAIDGEGNLSGACSTSGMAFKIHGRVGDSPIIGAGLYVDNEVGAATATGLGELVMKTLGAFLIVEFMRQGKTPEAACREAALRIAEKYGKSNEEMQVGYIALSKSGEYGTYSLHPGFNYSVSRKDSHEVLDAPYLAGNSH